MHILFVCTANVGRSQAAMEFYNQTHREQATSAGTCVNHEGEKLKERFADASILKVMREYGIDMSNNVRTQLYPAMLETADRIIVMANPGTVPKWLLNNPKTISWDIEDGRDKTVEQTRLIVEEIRAKVLSLES